MAAPEANITTLLNYYKKVFNDRTLENLALHPHNMCNAIPRKGGFEGEVHIEPIQVRRGVGASSSFVTAKNNYRPSKMFKWQLSRKKAYRFVTIEDEAVLASRSKMAAFVEQKGNEIKGAVEELGEKLAREAIGPGSGKMATVAAIDTVSTPNSITLTIPEDVDKFWTQMFLVAAANEFTGVIRAGTVEVIGKDIDAGKIYVDDATAITGLTVGDSLFVEGDRDDSGSNVITGIAAYIPLVAPTSADATLNGITGAERELYPEELAGWRQTTFPGSITEACEKLHAKMKRRGVTMQAVWLSYNNYRILKAEQGDRVTEDAGAQMKFGAPGIVMVSGGTITKFMPDAFMPEDRGYSLDMSTWKLKHMEALPHMVTTDGLKALRGADYDGVEMRWRYFAELVCNEPFRNGVFKIAYN